ncbi:MAG TPA: hypothetical protein VG015_06945 [Candidatus Dormibacteraeota bacterium]|nr:hypothetical protein [Candidatus Dormibacteraeota bacterium]
MILSPVCGELIPGSTPLLSFINPVVLIYFITFYGAGAVITREVARRQGLGWAGIVLLGAAYGVLEEGLTVTSWFNPHWPGVIFMGTYGRSFDTSWVWAAQLTPYHAIISITTPIVVVERLFPSLATTPWLGQRGLRRMIWVLGISSAVSLAAFGFISFRQQGYSHPPPAWFVALAIAAGLVWLALRQHDFRRTEATSGRRPPRLWSLRAFALIATALVCFSAWSGPHLVPAPVAVAIIAITLATAAWKVSTWSRRPGWGTDHAYALASGTLLLFVFGAPIGQPHARPEAIAVAFVALVGLIILSRLKAPVSAQAEPADRLLGRV